MEHYKGNYIKKYVDKKKDKYKLDRLILYLGLHCVKPIYS